MTVAGNEQRDNTSYCLLMSTDHRGQGGSHPRPRTGHEGQTDSRADEKRTSGVNGATDRQTDRQASHKASDLPVPKCRIILNAVSAAGST